MEKVFTLKEEKFEVVEKKLMAESNTSYLKLSVDLSICRLIEEAEQDEVILHVKKLHKEELAEEGSQK